MVLQDEGNVGRVAEVEDGEGRRGRGQQAEVDAADREEADREPHDEARDEHRDAERDVEEHERVVVKGKQPAEAQPLVPLGPDVEDDTVAAHLCARRGRARARV